MNSIKKARFTVVHYPQIITSQSQSSSSYYRDESYESHLHNRAKLNLYPLPSGVAHGYSVIIKLPLTVRYKFSMNMLISALSSRYPLDYSYFIYTYTSSVKSRAKTAEMYKARQKELLRRLSKREAV